SNLYAYVTNRPVHAIDLLGLWAYGDPSSWCDGRGYQPGQVEDEIGQSAQAALDGLNPFGDPFGNGGGYNQNDPYNQQSHFFGEIAKNALCTVAGLRAGAWLGGTRLGHMLNHNRFLRLGPGR